MPIWRSPMSNSLAVASRNTLPSSSTASNSFTLPAGERSPAAEIGALGAVEQREVHAGVAGRRRAVGGPGDPGGGGVEIDGHDVTRAPWVCRCSGRPRAPAPRLRGDGLVEPVHGVRAHDPVGDEPVGCWNAVTAFCVSAPKMPSGRLVPFFVEIGIAKPRSISASCSTCTPSPWEPRRSGGLFVEARTMSGSLEKRAHWRAMAHPLSGRGMMARRSI